MGTSASTQTASPVNLRALLEEMIERNASDLHITAGERAKLRVDGEITNSKNEYVRSEERRVGKECKA
jgi:Tfp pilus assembly pilus retraction ATPase PilT